MYMCMQESVHTYPCIQPTHAPTYRVLWRFCTTTKVRRGLYCGLMRVHAALMAGTYLMGLGVVGGQVSETYARTYMYVHNTHMYTYVHVLQSTYLVLEHLLELPLADAVAVEDNAVREGLSGLVELEQQLLAHGL